MIGKLLGGQTAPDCIFAMLDLLAAGALDAAIERQIVAPDQIALVTVTDLAVMRPRAPR